MSSDMRLLSAAGLGAYIVHSLCEALEALWNDFSVTLPSFKLPADVRSQMLKQVRNLYETCII